jgi:hypothetical protein
MSRRHEGNKEAPKYNICQDNRSTTDLSIKEILYKRNYIVEHKASSHRKIGAVKLLMDKKELKIVVHL